MTSRKISTEEACTGAQILFLKARNRATSERNAVFLRERLTAYILLNVKLRFDGLLINCISNDVLKIMEWRVVVLNNLNLTMRVVNAENCEKFQSYCYV